MTITLERETGVVTGEWNHSHGPSCPPNCTVNLVERPEVDVVTAPRMDSPSV